MTNLEKAIRASEKRGSKRTWSDMDFTNCASSELRLAEALKLAVEALNEIMTAGDGCQDYRSKTVLAKIEKIFE